MSPMSIIVVALLLALAATSLAFTGGAAIVAIPLAVIGICVVGFLDLRRRSRQAKEVQGFRDQAKAEKVEFTGRDQETLVSE